MKQWKKVLTESLILFLLCVTLTGIVEAKPACVKNMTCYMYDSAKSKEVQWFPTIFSSSIFIKDLSKNAKITNIVSSNKLVEGVAGNHASYKRGPSVNLSTLYKNPKQTIKPGTKVKISFSVKQDGKTYKLSCVVKFIKVPSPAKSFKVGDVEVASQFSGNDIVKMKHGGIKNISYKSGNGFEIAEVRAYSNKELQNSYMDYDLSGNYTPVGKVIPNGGEVDTGKIDVLQIYYRPVKKPKYYAEATMMGMNPGNLYDYVMVVFE